MTASFLASIVSKHLHCCVEGRALVSHHTSGSLLIWRAAAKAAASGSRPESKRDTGTLGVSPTSSVRRQISPKRFNRPMTASSKFGDPNRPDMSLLGFERIALETVEVRAAWPAGLPLWKGGRLAQPIAALPERRRRWAEHQRQRSREFSGCSLQVIAPGRIKEQGIIAQHDLPVEHEPERLSV